MLSTFLTAFKDISFTYQAIQFILSIGLIISSLEDLKTWSIYSSDGLLSWKVARLANQWKAKGVIGSVLNLFLSDKGFKTILWGRLGASIGLLVLALFNIVSPLLICTLLLLTVLITVRSPYGLNGAYQMSIVILLALAFASLAGLNSQTSLLCLWFIAGQLFVSYLVAGFNKLYSPIWRKSHALFVIFSTRTFGHAPLYQLLMKNKMLTALISWTIFLFEITFVGILFLNPEHALVLLILGAFFHLNVAIFMGLNDFLFSFTATYPAVLYLVNLPIA